MKSRQRKKYVHPSTRDDAPGRAIYLLFRCLPYRKRIPNHPSNFSEGSTRNVAFTSNEAAGVASYGMIDTVLNIIVRRAPIPTIPLDRVFATPITALTMFARALKVMRRISKALADKLRRPKRAVVGSIRLPGLRAAIMAATAAGILTLAAGCALMPAGAPTALEVENTGPSLVNQIAVFDIDEEVIAALVAVRPEGFAGRFSSKAPAADLRIAVGDTLQISVIEQSPGLLGAPSGASSPAQSSTGLGSTSFLPVTVGHDGAINVPFAGSVRAAGLTLEALRAEIEHKLMDKAVNPQVQVAQVGGGLTGANSATVGGEVNRAAVVPLRPSGSRLLDVVAEAGGSHYPAFETTVRRTRGHREAAASLQRVVESPDENIFIYPNDSVFLTHDPKTFTVLGASTKVGRYPFGSETLNLAEAVAEAGGFVDAASDPSGVFVFRYEPLRFVEKLRPDVPPANEVDPAPVIYRLNLREGDGYFRAKRFAMRDKDIVLVANSDGAQLLKFVNLLQGITSNVQNVASTVLTIKTINTAGGAAIVTTSQGVTATGTTGTTAAAAQ
jgi:polysaccharide export outer membrane protein